MISPPANQTAVQKTNQITSRDEIDAAWQQFFTETFVGINAIQQSGTTAQRPTKNLWIGRPYFDTTLGYRIDLRSVKPNVWVNGAGVPV